ncbi:MAG: helix-turn-helix transcriptional regulator [Cyclobacteriaceae bacterium]
MMESNQENMEQPQLGKKISELRKASRLTQEELVEKCNISIRTIQRIESGEVTPRSYTVKTIFSALNYDLDSQDEQMQGSTVRQYFNEHGEAKPATYSRWLTISWYMGMCYFIIRFVESIAEYSRFMSDNPVDNEIYVAIKVAILFTLIFFQIGFVAIGKVYDNPLLKMASFLVIGASVLIIGFDIVTTYLDVALTEVVIYVYSFGFGAVGLMFGVALLKLRPHFGNIAVFAGVIEIVAGCLSLTVVLSFLQPVILVPAELLEIVIIFLAIRKIKKETAPA